MGIAFPVPDQAIVARRDDIIAGLARLLPADGLVTSDDERRAFETDDNEVVVLGSDGSTRSVPRASKAAVSDAVWDSVVPLLS